MYCLPPRTCELSRSGVFGEVVGNQSDEELVALALVSGFFASDDFDSVDFLSDDEESDEPESDDVVSEAEDVSDFDSLVEDLEPLRLSVL